MLIGSMTPSFTLTVTEQFYMCKLVGKETILGNIFILAQLWFILRERIRLFRCGKYVLAFFV